jgi:ADP-dependent NAD(P)H-hydrate dehydratase / NAD(P)H-hydrate epimerase
MQIFSAEQLRLWDEFTIAHEPISSINLMERAATRCVEWLEEHQLADKSFAIYCGKGNNGGDGLAIARMLARNHARVMVHILEFGHKGTEDFQINLARLHGSGAQIHFVQSEENFHEILKDDIIIDALFGTGLNRPLEGVTAKLIEQINASGNTVVAIDIPSGLYVDRHSNGSAIVKARYTLSFQCYKPAFLVSENEAFTGEVYLLDIGLDKGYLQAADSRLQMTDLDMVRSILKPRNKFAHKGNFGHALLVAGGFGKMGAAEMAARACLRSGAGLLTCHVPGCGNQIMQTAIPESMLEVDQNEFCNTVLSGELSKYSVIGVGPGIGTAEETKHMVLDLIRKYPKPLVIDADGLNILAMHPDMLRSLPPNSILTPHPKEFERLFGPSTDDFERQTKALAKSREYQCVIVLKGHYSFIATPSGKGWFNSTGNPGMAKGGSGDVLTGIITGLLSQSYPSSEAAILGTFIHGLAGDLAAETFSEQAMLPTDLVELIGKAFQQISGIPVEE